MFKEINQNSFFGNFLYQQVIPQDHFLRKLDKVIDFSFVNEIAKDCYENLGKPGNRPYEPVILFKELLLAFLYDVSDREIEEQVNLNLAFKWFVGLPVNGFAPDHSTLTYFRDRLGQKRFEEIFNQIVKQARDKGLIDDKLKIIDSTHIEAKVNTNRLSQEFKEKLEKTPEDLNNQGIDKSNYIDKTSPDPDARFGRKSKHKKFYGYKEHIRIDADSEIIEKIEITPGNIRDGDMLESLMEGVKSKRYSKKKTKILADKDYDSNYNHQVIENQHCQSFIILKKHRKDKKFKKRMKSELYQTITRWRYKVERRYADAKNNHGLGKCRWLGRFKTEIQAYMTSIVLNCKRIVLLTYQNSQYCLQKA